MKKSKNTLLLIALLLLLVVSISYVSGTYAKYTAEVTNSGKAKVAKWAFNAENGGTTTLAISLDGTYDVSTLVANRIAPGTKGHFDIQLTNAQSEVGVDFTLVLTNIDDKPTNLKFFKNSDYTGELVVGTTEITGQIEADDGTGVSIPIYWEWVYETTGGDAQDTSDGEAAKELTIGAKITAVQTRPGAAITTHIN